MASRDISLLSTCVAEVIWAEKENEKGKGAEKKKAKGKDKEQWG